MEKAVGNNEVFGTLLTNLLKALDVLAMTCHDKIGSSYSIWEDITSGVSQGSILGALLFNVFLCDFFLEYENNYFANFAGNTKKYIVDENTKSVNNTKIYIVDENTKEVLTTPRYILLMKIQKNY